MVDEYLTNKQREIRKLQNSKSILSLTKLAKKKQKAPKMSRQHNHLDLIIEEYINLDYINNDILFQGSKTKYRVNYTSVGALSFNEDKLDERVQDAIDQERSADKEFKLLKLHGLHHIKHDFKEVNKILEKVNELSLSLQKVSTRVSRTNKVEKLFKHLSEEQQQEFLAKIEDKIVSYETDNFNRQIEQLSSSTKPSSYVKKK